MSGRVQVGKSGPATYLSVEEESDLVEFLSNCAKIGYACTRKQVIAIVRQCSHMRGMEVTVTNGWWESFRRHHPDIMLRTVEKLAYIRMVSSSSEIIDNYFDLLESTLLENDLCHMPCQIF